MPIEMSTPVDARIETALHLAAVTDAEWLAIDEAVEYETRGLCDAVWMAVPDDLLQDVIVELMEE